MLRIFYYSPANHRNNIPAADRIIELEMKFLKSLTEGIKDAVGIEKKWEWGDEEMEWFHNFEKQLATYRHKIEKRAEPYYKQFGVPLISRREFVELCR